MENVVKVIEILFASRKDAKPLRGDLEMKYFSLHPCASARNKKSVSFARMYAPEIGCFLQTDPLGYIDTINPYAYCANNPLNWIDPWGLSKGDKNVFEKFVDFLLNLLPQGSPEPSLTIAGGAAGIATFCNAEAKRRAVANHDAGLSGDDALPTAYSYGGLDPKTGKPIYRYVGNE